MTKSKNISCKLKYEVVSQSQDHMSIEEISSYVEDQLSTIQGESNTNRRFALLENGQGTENFKDIKHTDSTSFGALLFTRAIHKDLAQNLVWFKEILKEEWFDYSKERKKQDGITFKMAIDACDILDVELRKALDMLEKQGYLDDKTVQKLDLNACTAHYVSVLLERKVEEYVNKIPDLYSSDEAVIEKHRGQWYYGFLHIPNRKKNPFLYDKMPEKSDSYVPEELDEVTYSRRSLKEKFGNFHCRSILLGVKNDVTYQGSTQEGPLRPTALMNDLRLAITGSNPDKGLTKEQCLKYDVPWVDPDPELLSFNQLEASLGVIETSVMLNLSLPHVTSTEDDHSQKTVGHKKPPTVV